MFGSCSFCVLVESTVYLPCVDTHTALALFIWSASSRLLHVFYLEIKATLFIREISAHPNANSRPRPPISHTRPNADCFLNLCLSCPRLIAVFCGRKIIAFVVALRDQHSNGSAKVLAREYSPFLCAI